MSQSIKVKRQITIKTIITDSFKEKASSEISGEMKLLDEQIYHLELQINQIVQQFQQTMPASLSISPQEAEQIINELNLKLQQLVNLKQNMQSQISNIQNSRTGDLIVTGSLENYTELKTGDNIYDHMLDNEIIVKDGIIQEIKC
jgi:hypothetical protein